MANTCRCTCHPHTQWGPDSRPDIQRANHPDCNCVCCPTGKGPGVDRRPNPWDN